MNSISLLIALSALMIASTFGDQKQRPKSDQPEANIREDVELTLVESEDKKECYVHSGKVGDHSMEKKYVIDLNVVDRNLLRVMAPQILDKCFGRKIRMLLPMETFPDDENKQGGPIIRSKRQVVGVGGIPYTVGGFGTVGGGFVNNGLVTNGLVGNGLVGNGLVGNGLVGGGIIGNGLIGGGFGGIGGGGLGLGCCCPQYITTCYVCNSCGCGGFGK